MTYRIGGQVVDQGSGVSGQPVFVVDTGDADPTNWTVEAATTTNADGSWSVVVSSGGLERYHAVTQFEDGSTLKNAESKPFVTGQPVVRPVEIPIQFDIPAPQTIGNALPDKLGFESGDFSGWSGQLGDWDIVTSPVFEGTFAAQSTNDVNTAIFYEDFPTEQGQIISMRMFGDGNNTGTGLLFGVQDGSDAANNLSGYGATRQGAGSSNSVELLRFDNGGATTLDSTSQPPPENQWSQHLVEWHTNGDIVYNLKDESGNTVETLTANDTTYTSGYIGARKNDGGDTEDMAVDNFEIVGTL